MSFLCVLMSFFLLFSGPFFESTVKSTVVFNEAPNLNFVKYNGEIKNIFIHSLIAYPEILENKSKNTIICYDKDCIDYIEFENMLKELHKNNYVLVDINDTFCLDENGNAIKKTIYLPKGKKPVVIGVDDVVYDPKKTGNGMVDKLCLDDAGNFYTETYINGKRKSRINI